MRSVHCVTIHNTLGLLMESFVRCYESSALFVATLHVVW